MDFDRESTLERKQAYKQYMQQAAPGAGRVSRQDEPQMFQQRENTVDRKARVRNELRNIHAQNDQLGTGRQGTPEAYSRADRARKSELPKLPAAQRPVGPIGYKPSVPAPAPRAYAPAGDGDDTTAAAPGDGARFRALERQCVELREERRQILKWLAATQQQLEDEVTARKRMEQQQLLQLTQVTGAQAQDAGGLGSQIRSAELRQESHESAVARATSAITDTISQLSSDLNALSFFVASGGSLGGQRVAEIARTRGEAAKGGI
jgi:hypothetical protein